MNEQLKWLNQTHWVVFDGTQVLMGHMSSSSLVSHRGVVQEGVKQVAVGSTNLRELWHLGGAKVWVSRSRWKYRPAAFILVEGTGESREGHLCYKTLTILETGRRYKRLLQDLLKEEGLTLLTEVEHESI